MGEANLARRSSRAIVSMRARGLFLLLPALFGAGCFTGHLLEECDQESTLTLPRDSDAVGVNCPARNSDYVTGKVRYNVLGLALFIGPAVALDLATAPLQYAFDVYPFGRRYEPD